MSSFYSEEELQSIGFKAVGTGVLLSRKASIYGAQNIVVGNNVRIDDFCILSGSICFGNNIHIAAGCYLYGGAAGIVLHNYSGLSSKTTIYATTDDYSGESLTNPTVSNAYRNVIESEVIVGKHVVVGAGSIILPGVVIGEGCSFGSMSLVNKSTEAWGIYVGIPCKRVKERSRKLLDFEKKFESRTP